MVILKKLLRRDSKKPICIDQKDKMCHPGHQTAASCPIPVSYVWNAATKRAGVPPSLEESCLVRWEEATRDGWFLILKLNVISTRQANADCRSWKCACAIHSSSIHSSVHSQIYELDLTDHLTDSAADEGPYSRSVPVPGTIELM